MLQQRCIFFFFLMFIFKKLTFRKLPGIYAHLHAVWSTLLASQSPETEISLKEEWQNFRNIMIFFFLSRTCTNVLPVMGTSLIQFCLTGIGSKGLVVQLAQKPAASWSVKSNTTTLSYWPCQYPTAFGLRNHFLRQRDIQITMLCTP